MAELNASAKIWHNGELIPWDDAHIHVCSHVVHYASAVFEGIRCYKTQSGPAVFRLDEHVKRLCRSARIYRMPIKIGAEGLREACPETIQAKQVESCYIRPIAFRGYHSLGLDPTTCPVEIYVAVFEFDKYLGEESLQQGVDVMVSSWNRVATNTLPGMAKAAANYMNAALIKMEAAQNGYVEGIALDSRVTSRRVAARMYSSCKITKSLPPPSLQRYFPGLHVMRLWCWQGNSATRSRRRTFHVSISTRLTKFFLLAQQLR